MMRPNMGTERTHKIDAVASDWLIRRESGVWSADDQACLNDWLNASTLNRVAVLRLELAWEDAARLKAWGAGVRGDRPPPPGRWNLTPFFDHPDSVPDEDAQTDLAESDAVHPAVDESPQFATTDASPLFEDTSAQIDAGSPGAGEVVSRERDDDSLVLLPSSAPRDTQPSTDRAKPRRVRHRRFTLAAAATLLFALSVGVYLAVDPKGDRYATPVRLFASVSI